MGCKVAIAVVLLQISGQIVQGYVTPNARGSQAYQPAVQFSNTARAGYSAPASSYSSPAAASRGVGSSYSPSAPSRQPARNQANYRPAAAYATPTTVYKAPAAVAYVQPRPARPTRPATVAYSPVSQQATPVYQAPSYKQPAARHVQPVKAYKQPSATYDLPAVPNKQPAVPYQLLAPSHHSDRNLNQLRTDYQTTTGFNLRRGSLSETNRRVNPRTNVLGELERDANRGLFSDKYDYDYDYDLNDNNNNRADNNNRNGNYGRRGNDGRRDNFNRRNFDNTRQNGLRRNIREMDREHEAAVAHALRNRNSAAVSTGSSILFGVVLSMVMIL